MREQTRGLSSNALKLIALLTMFLDHIGAVLIVSGWMNQVLRMVGRVSFPIFAFLLVEGFLHTRDVKRYGLRLLAFGFLSEIPFDLALFHTPFEMSHQNVFFTLFLGLLALEGCRRYEDDASLWKRAAVLVVCGFAAIILRTDYEAFGVIFIVLLYMTRQSPRLQTIMGSLALVWELPAVFAFIPIRMYNGTRGTLPLKYIFYICYPLHLFLLWGIWRLL